MIQRSLEIASNLAIVIVAAVLVYFVFVRGPSTEFSPEPVKKAPTTGASIAIKGLDFSKGQSNLLMALSTHCHFCAESIPFYKRILEKNKGSKRLRIIAAFPESVDEAKRYLKNKDLEVDDVVTTDLETLHTSGTPTLILLNNNGAVINSWLGRLRPETEGEVIQHLFPGE